MRQILLGRKEQRPLNWIDLVQIRFIEIDVDFFIFMLFLEDSLFLFNHDFQFN